MDIDVRRQYLDAMGIRRWVRKEGPRAEGRGPELKASAPASQVVAPNPQPPAPSGDVAALDWDALQARVAVCAGCELHRSRTQTVFGVGDREADWMVIGEAPGADEDRQGEPFVGRAGQLLNAMLEAVGLKREQVYIANILKCRPPNNRDPLPEEVAQCEPYLKRQVALVKPRVILAVGRIAAHNLLKTDDRVGALRGRRLSYGDIPVVVTYHPAYLLRSPKEKRKAWQDLLFARRLLDEGKNGKLTAEG